MVYLKNLPGYIFNHFYEQYLVLLTMVTRNIIADSVFASIEGLAGRIHPTLIGNRLRILNQPLAVHIEASKLFPHEGNNRDERETTIPGMQT